MGPLSGIRVVDITRLLPGGFCSHLLASYGADVVKVEQPGLGDYLRKTPPLQDDVSLVHTMINSGKRSIGIDLKNADGKEVLRRLVAKSDVFLEGFRPGVADQLGFSFDEVKKMNGRIVYCSISSFGRASSLSSMPAHDLNFQAMSGLLGSAGRPQVPFVQLGDYISGMYGTIGILAAIQGPERRATHVDVPIVQSLMSLLMLPASSYFTTREPPARGQSLVFGSEPYYSLYMTKDGRYLAVAAIESRFWENLMRSLGLERLSGLRDGTKRERQRLRTELKRVFATKTQKEWASSLMKRDTCVSPVLDIHEAIDSPWARESGVVGSVGGRSVLNPPLVFSDGGTRSEDGREEAPGAELPDAPSLGEHTRAILRELGYGAGQVGRLFESRAVA